MVFGLPIVLLWNRSGALSAQQKTENIIPTIGKWNPWLIEAFVLPFAILGVVIILIFRLKWTSSVSKNTE